MPTTDRRQTVGGGHPRRFERRGTGFRAVILAGAALTIGVWVFAGLSFGSRLARVQEEARELSRRYLRAQQLLTEARNQVLLSSVYLREALLDPSELFVDDSRRRMTDALDTAERNLARYVPILDSRDEHDRVARLVAEVHDLRREMVDVLGTDRSQWRAQAGALLRGRLMPRREAVMRVADELGTLNRTAFVEHQVETVAIYRRTQAQVWQILGLALAASLGIAGLAWLYVGRLERRVQEQQARDAELQADLHRLSSSLIKAREDERRSIARELHDEIGQLLTAAKVELAVAGRTSDTRNERAAALEDTRHIVDRALHAVRDLSRLLHPAMLDDLGLVAAVDWQVRGFTKRHDIEVRFAHEGLDTRLPSEVETAAYRIVQEALTNIARHAHARRAAVRLSRHLDRLVIEIEDEGQGFPAEDVQAPGGLGLVSMRERSAQLGGSLSIESDPGRGTRIVVELPVPAPPRSEPAAFPSEVHS